ncbi:MAG TPA: GIDE domain-containing protein [Kofleriaceae bacterium]|nr:GIDE domain-containing protein [Kofleriaceae bacterium]
MPILAVAIVVLFIVVVVRAWSSRAKLARQLRDAPASTIAALPEGESARVVGTVVGEATLIAPLTGRRCVAYVAQVEQRVSTGKTTYWKGLIDEVRHHPFTIDDGTGKAIIDPGQAKLLIEMDSTSRSGTFDDATPAESEFLARHQIDSKGWFLNKSLRYLEGVIEPGERVAVLGRAVREPDPEAARDATGYRDALPTRVRIGGSKDQPILVSDRKDLTRARG